MQLFLLQYVLITWPSVWCSDRESLLTCLAYDFCLQVGNLKERGMEFLTIPNTYYENLRARLKDAPITVTEDLDVVS